MGTWGTSLYSDDLASDLRDEFRTLIGDGLSTGEAIDRLAGEYLKSPPDPDDTRVFWLVVADTAWRLGRPHRRATREALRVIKSGAELERWTDPKARRQRERTLAQVAERLRSPASRPKNVPRRVLAANGWDAGDLVAYQLASGAWTVFRVIGHHVDKGGKSAVLEPLDWSGPQLPDQQQLGKPKVRPIRRSQIPKEKWFTPQPQFMLCEPRRPQDRDCLVCLNWRLAPKQLPARYWVFGFPGFDKHLREVFGWK